MLGYRNVEIKFFNFMLLNDYEATNIGDFCKSKSNESKI
jgi:hypothetical protein